MPDDATARAQELERDRDLVRRLVAGDAGAWDEFVQRFQADLVAAARRAYVPDDDVDDAVSYILEALLADGYRRLRLWEGRARLRTYVGVVAANLARDYRRALPRFEFADEDEEPEARDDTPTTPGEAEGHALSAEYLAAIEQCLARLRSPADREILLQRYEHGLTPEQIAEQSGRTRNAVDVALHRARQRFMELAQGEHPDLAQFLREK